jgi:phospholipase C
MISLYLCCYGHYGVRVPAVIVSPYIQKGTVSTTVYDHTSILATLRTLFTSVQGLPLTNRDAKVENLLPLLTLSTPRTDTLTFASPSPCAGTLKIPLTNAQRYSDAKALPVPPWR